MWIFLVICFVSLFFKKDYFIEILLIMTLLIGSSLFIFLRLKTLDQAVTQDLILTKSSVKIVAITQSDVQVRENKNPYTDQSYWEVLAKSKSLSEEENTWNASLPIILTFSQEPSGLTYGASVEVVGQIAASYRDDKAFLVRVEEASIAQHPSYFYSEINRFRENFSQVAKSVNHSAAGLIPGLVSGDTRLQSDEFTEAMRKTGLTHLTAVSGGNIAILLAVFIWFFKALTLRRKSVFSFSLLLLIVFLFLVRFEPSAMRATVMGLIGIWSLTFGGPRTSFGALNFSIIFLLLIDPFLATNWGFMLSVAATAGLILLAPQIQKLWVAHLPKTPKFLILLITMTLSAQLVTYPLIGFMVGEISLISLAANALAMPTVAWVTVFGFLTLISATVAPPLSIFFIYLALPAAIWIEFVANSLAKFPFAQISFSSVTFFALITAVSAVVGYKYRNLIRISLLEERK